MGSKSKNRLFRVKNGAKKMAKKNGAKIIQK